MSEQLTPGTRLADRYTITALVQASPHEQLYRGVTDWGQAVLLNVFYAPHAGTPTGSRVRQAFTRNARLLAQVQHPNVVRVNDILDEADWQVVVFEDQLKTSLREALSGSATPPEAALDLVRTAVQALAAAHSQALLHHRISPESLWFDRQGKLVLGQFGLATRALAELREAGPVDPRYAAPELMSGGQYTPQTDVYALCATLLEAITGISPPPASARQQGVPLAQPGKKVPPQVTAALTEGLRLQPAERAISASEVLEVLLRPVMEAQAPAESDPVTPEPIAVPVAPAPPPGPTAASAAPQPGLRAAPIPAPARPSRSAVPVVLGAVGVLLTAGLAFAFLGKNTSSAGERALSAEVTGAAASETTGTQVDVAAPAADVPEVVLRTEIVNTANLNLRSEASNSAAILTTLPRGTALSVLLEQGEWLQVSDGRGARGWVNATLTLPLRTPVETDALLQQAQTSGVLELPRGAFQLAGPLVLTGTVTLSGAGAKQTLLFSDAAADTVIAREANISLTNLGIAHTGTLPARALLQEGGSLTLENVTLSGAVRDDETSEFGSGLWVKDGGEASIQGTLFTGNVFGLYVSDTSRVQVTASTFTANRDGGLFLKDSSTGSIADNTIQESGAHGIHVAGQATPDISGNRIRANRGRGLTIYGAAAPTVRANTIEENVLQGIGIQGTAAPQVERNIIQGNRQSGITYFDNASGTAAGNTVQANRTAGIRVTDYATPTLSGNTITRNRENGIGYSEGASGTATANQISENDKPGIAAWGDARPNLAGNVVTRNKQSGVVMAERSAGQVAGNEITSNSLYGLIVTGAASPSVVENTVTGNLQGGIYYKQDATGMGYGNTCYGNGAADLSADLNPGNQGPDFQADGCVGY